jgi:predicted nuclease of restriction endonuclease-like (RecB) superfamily
MDLDQEYSSEYRDWIIELKSKIQSAQLKAAISVNKELLSLYWEIGKSISTKIIQSKWGASVVEQLSKDLKTEFPNQKGFSRSNLFSMKQWFEFYSTSDIELKKIQQLVGQIPWGHNLAIITKSDTTEEALFYCNKTIENNWSRSILINQISSGFYNRKGKAITNFNNTSTETHSELAIETLKDPYKLDFLDLHEKILEKDLEAQLVKHITSFLLELGSGFSFVGRQVPVKIDNQDFYIDLLFYHIKLKCYVVIELKAIEFKAEFAGKMNLYLSAVDDSLKNESDNQTIGLLLCQSKSKIIAEYALRGMTQPIGIAEYELNKAIPKDLKSDLPTIETIEKELAITLAKKS